MIASVKTVLALRPDLAQESLRRPLYEVQGALEALGASVVRVGDLRLRSRRVVEKGAHLSPAPAESRYGPVVRLVHGEDKIEPVAVLGLEEARTLSYARGSGGSPAW